MIINFVPGEECRIAITVDGRLEEFYHERASSESHVGSIYEGRVTNVEASIQAAFIDFGLDRNGFLHISDLHPMYFPGPDREEFERVGQKTARRDRPPIQKCLQRGKKVLVQVLKEGIGTKGPTLTSYLSIPGRYIVMMPQMERLGVSRKVEDDDARREMKKILADLNPPDGFGFIVRTAGMGQTKTELKRDLAYLQRLWKSIEARRKKLKGPGELYAESDLIIRTIRDVFSSDISRVLVDDPIAAARVRDFLAVVNPRSKSSVVYYNDPVPLFHRFNIEAQIDGINARQVPLPSGGYLVIDQTEALVAIDVNSGKSRDARDAETNAYNTNLEAVDEIARQLRLRDLGGVIVNDLIDMRDTKRRRKIETRFRDNLKKDRARTRINAISQFGLLEMTRQRMRPAVGRAFSVKCNHCLGVGHVKSAESTAIEVMRQLALVMHRSDIDRIELTVSGDTAFQLLNRKRAQLVALEKRFDKSVMVRVGGSGLDYVNITAYDPRGGMLDAESIAESMKIAPPSGDTFVKADDPAFARILDVARASGSPLPPALIGLELDDEPVAEDEDDTPPAPGNAPGSAAGSKTDDHDDEADDDDAADASGEGGEGETGEGGKRKRRRGSRGGRRRRKREREAAERAAQEAAGHSEAVDGADAGEDDEHEPNASASADDADDADDRQPAPQKAGNAPPKAPASRGGSGVLPEEGEEDEADNIGNRIDAPQPQKSQSQSQGDGSGSKRRRKRRRRGSSSGGGGNAASGNGNTSGGASGGTSGGASGGASGGNRSNGNPPNAQGNNRRENSNAGPASANASRSNATGSSAANTGSGNASGGNSGGNASGGGGYSNRVLGDQAIA